MPQPEANSAAFYVCTPVVAASSPLMMVRFLILGTANSDPPPRGTAVTAPRLTLLVVEDIEDESALCEPLEVASNSVPTLNSVPRFPHATSVWVHVVCGRWLLTLTLGQVGSGDRGTAHVLDIDIEDESARGRRPR